jgi:hypothetical protein
MTVVVDPQEVFGAAPEVSHQPREIKTEHVATGERRQHRYGGEKKHKIRS